LCELVIRTGNEAWKKLIFKLFAKLYSNHLLLLYLLLKSSDLFTVNLVH
jgi:hypothetical protein